MPPEKAMESQTMFILTLSLLFLSGVQAVNFIVRNNCPYTVWPGILTSSGPVLDNTGFELPSGNFITLNVAPSWSGRLWGRTSCSIDATTAKFNCATGDCASGQVSCNGAGGIPPATLIELTLNGYKDQDFYDISLVDGFNVPASISPAGHGDCKATSCGGDINGVCPPELAVMGANGRTVACKSACLALNEPRYCCIGSYNTPETCPPTEYSKIFKAQCPKAYSYAYDDKTSTFTCPSGADYVIAFCP
ncbi:Thaumatin family [Dillenia turbinata]|uniref:Thaumatin family n=1 Tax=Dillenia turbinata TaxID=194707 RepID=A0AAN8VXJ2_9MAGN